MQERTFGPYRVLRKLGAGGMGEVFVGEHALIGRKAAIKVLHADRAESRTAIDRFFNEARAASAISDPGIVQIYDFGISPDGTAYIVMELLEGESLQDRLRRVGSVPLLDALRIVRQTASSLAAAHAAGIIHRDLKPDNLFMIRDPEAAGGERPKILDFGIAKLDGEMPKAIETRTGQVMGTPVYMSPEQCNDSGKIDHRTDIYALGCVLNYLLTGRPPFEHQGVGKLISAHLNEPPKRPSSKLAHIPPVIDAVVMRCLEKQPADRFATMTELAMACDAAARDIASMPTISLAPVSAAPFSPPLAHPTTLGAMTGQSAAPASRPSKGLWIGLSVVVLALAIGGVVAATGGGGSKDFTDPGAMPGASRAPATAPEPHVEPATPAPTPAPPPAPKPEAAPDPAPDPVVEAAGSAKPAVKPAIKVKRPATKSRPTKPDDAYDDR